MTIVRAFLLIQLLLTGDSIAASAFTPSWNSQSCSSMSSSMRSSSSTSALSISPQQYEEQQHYHHQVYQLVPYTGERAMAKNIRNLRTNRGRLLVQEQGKAAAASCDAPPNMPAAVRSTVITASASSNKKKKNTKKTNRSSSSSSALPKQRIVPQKHIFSYQDVLQVLQAYSKIHNDLILPRRFIVPATKDYPKQWHGVDLSSHIYNMSWWTRHVKNHPHRVTELNDLGFCWQRLQPEWNLILEALITYSSLNGHLLVPATFVVPRNDVWPKATWELHLGNCVHRIRLRHDFVKCHNDATRRSQLDGLGFCWDVRELRFAKFCAALKHYQQQHHNNNAGAVDMKIPTTFVIPANDTAWPTGLWNYPLGAKCSAVRQKGLYVKDNVERQQYLMSTFGFRWNVGNAARGWYKVVHAAAVYSQLHHRDLNVPINFVVPSPPQIQSHNVFYVLDGASDVVGTNDYGAWPWPQHLWGFPLGQRLKDVRLKGAYLRGKDAAKRRAQLDGLGFNWTPKRGRRKRG